MSKDRTAEILNYVSAISREVGILRTEMHSRFDEHDRRFEHLETEMRAGFEAVRADVRHLSDRWKW
ncbi:MAG TPA: hypothetical protein VF546_20025 [Pyrinomonadaceae bacterium]|jgi:hypothetical protein